ncbi:4a-hydroxytetrahydrobiopterin dehydratase [Marinihelvus fidelis]|uniref:Putative pterin-4-alpha-carbinolamine dehydratase n=1 Tax=Marinihelvus fidelis TaxID=2613842 RepID=A0A5N0TC88_9GAMM|nr:4a-hydroxytetrahydrobiopterin dehydratase [Marinihelvus fidelis]KAA9132034.1 4a-hydroxytetrahydrobiopterin dehydratase [Marinihelvus fidelis]
MSLSERQCRPCEGGTERLPVERARKLLRQLEDWRMDADGLEIKRTFRIEGFSRVLDFINRLAWLSHRQGHHPDFRVFPGGCVVRYSTHAIGGLSENDFICAARLDRLARD